VQRPDGHCKECQAVNKTLRIASPLRLLKFEPGEIGNSLSPKRMVNGHFATVGIRPGAEVRRRDRSTIKRNRSFDVYTRVVRHNALHRETTIRTKREGHGDLAGWHSGEGWIKPQGRACGNGGIDQRDVVRSPGNDWSVLLLTRRPTTIPQVSMSCLLWPKDLLLRLKPVIKWTLAHASFVVREGTCGDPFMECCWHRRGGRLWCRSTGRSLARRFRFGGGLRFSRGLRFGRGFHLDWLLRFHESLPMSSIMNQIGDGKARPSLGRCQGETVAACDGFTPRNR
jgi:hypothetical protein